MRWCAGLGLVWAACRFSPTAAPSDSAGPHDASQAVPDTLDAADVVDAAVAPAIKPIQSITKGYGTDDNFSLEISAAKDDVLIAATYESLAGVVTVSDTQSLPWKSLTTYSEQSEDCDVVQAQFWYAVLPASVTTTVTLHQTDAAAIGMQLVEYAGVSPSSPIDGDVGAAATAITTSLTTPALTTAHYDAVLAVFADVDGTGKMTSGAGWTPRGSDSSFYTLLVDNVPGAGAGTFTPDGVLPGPASDCWVGAAIALRAR